MKSRSCALALTLVLASCPGSDRPRDGGPCTAPESPPRCAEGERGPRIFASCSDYFSGALDALGRQGACVAPDVGPVSSDAVLAWHGGLLVALNYGLEGVDNVTWFDVSSSPPTVVQQLSVARPGGSNARGYLALDGSRGYVSLNTPGVIAAIDLTAGTVRDAVDLTPYRGGGLRAWPAGMARVGPYAWVLLQRLGVGAQPSASPGAIAVIDPASDRVVDVDETTPGTQVIELSHSNPVGTMRVQGSRVLVACVGSYLDITDGAVEAIDTTTMRPLGAVVTEQDVGGNIDAVLPLDDDRLLLRVVAQARDSTALGLEDSRLVVWSISQRQASGPWITVPNYGLTEPLLARDGRVYVGDRGDEASCRPHGIRVFNAATGRQLTTEPIALTLQPYDLIEEPAGN
jgi:hypothetical protein